MVIFYSYILKYKYTIIILYTLSIIIFIPNIGIYRLIYERKILFIIFAYNGEMFDANE